MSEARPSWKSAESAERALLPSVPSRPLPGCSGLPRSSRTLSRSRVSEVRVVSMSRVAEVTLPEMELRPALVLSFSSASSDFSWSASSACCCLSVWAVPSRSWSAAAPRPLADSSNAFSRSSLDCWPWAATRLIASSLRLLDVASAACSDACFRAASSDLGVDVARLDALHARAELHEPLLGRLNVGVDRRQVGATATGRGRDVVEARVDGAELLPEVARAGGRCSGCCWWGRSPGRPPPRRPPGRTAGRSARNATRPVRRGRSCRRRTG